MEQIEKFYKNAITVVDTAVAGLHNQYPELLSTETKKENKLVRKVKLFFLGLDYYTVKETFRKMDRYYLALPDKVKKLPEVPEKIVLLKELKEIDKHIDAAFKLLETIDKVK